MGTVTGAMEATCRASKSEPWRNDSQCFLELTSACAGHVREATRQSLDGLNDICGGSEWELDAKLRLSVRKEKKKRVSTSSSERSILNREVIL